MSPATSIVITNRGRGASGSLAVIITGADAAEFITQNGCSTLQSMGTCTVTATFKPVSAGAKTANLVIEASPGGSISIPLTGTATN